ncbi:uncharacterized protein SCHCODRAFT_01190416 [Schizophyllum commune H4-8]|nr:uncharacterized protein SCHCODRAFT_01190416 [Schizophyllum commune H4-8]KAI5891478.1 hypothetical protein SCHCODRAFT_01190416 [Schizophyllum commune H4-8]
MFSKEQNQTRDSGARLYMRSCLAVDVDEKRFTGLEFIRLSSYHYRFPLSILSLYAALARLVTGFRTSLFGMNAHAFVNLIHFAYARDPPKDTDTRFHYLGDLPEDLFRRFLECCPPLTLVVLRQVCKAFRQILDDNPIIWANARENISWPSPPLDNDGRPRTEWTWAVRVAKRISSEWMDWTVPRSDRSQIWLSRYRDQWADTQDENMKRVHELVGRRGPNQASGEGAAARIVRAYMRTPACIALLRIFNHSLEIITDAAWNDALPAIHRELGLISSCDPAKIPPDYQCDDYDRILCPACHPRPLGTRWRVTQLATTSKKHKWFEENTILVHKLYEHYETKYVWSSCLILDLYSQPSAIPISCTKAAPVWFPHFAAIRVALFARRACKTHRYTLRAV